MPSLCLYKEHRKTLTFLCITLYDTAVSLSSNKHQNNFMNLTKTLLQSFKPPRQPNYPFLKPAVLSRQELLEVCIYPNLYHHDNDFHGENNHSLQGDCFHGDYLNGGHIHGSHLHGTMRPRINLLLSLQLLKIILDTSISGTTIAKSIERDHIFPIMLCLASFINESIVLWDGTVECVNREDVKELSKTLLQILCKTLNEKWMESDNEGIQWLMFKVRSFHWSVELYLRFLLADYLSNKDAAAQFSVSHFLNTKWNTTYLKLDCLENVLAFLQCCQISPIIAEIQLQSILHHDTNDGLLVALVRALVQLLPQCTQPEWSNITKILGKLLERKKIHVPLSAKFICALPLIDFKEYAVQLGISSLFLMIFELLGSKSCPWSHATGIWKHTVKCYVNVMKELLGNIQDCSSTDQAKGFLIGQLFCHNLEVMGYIPESVKGQLFVLTLEIMSMLEELTEKTLKEIFFATKQDRIFQKLVLRMTDGDDKSTLRQKLKTINIIL
ncbi:gem-associated protein 4-like [Anneissia japonica]|uniref:gem-associated protein 4-like n=1 Tax=Anneissia japonica TaxID=1529436 RepID=UPI0014256616|nr:gem-associated protein 4-like [Anneissia japonica]